jgi:hypothetical protein
MDSNIGVIETSPEPGRLLSLEADEEPLTHITGPGNRSRYQLLLEQSLHLESAACFHGYLQQQSALELKQHHNSAGVCI